jgi:hypothetical protein
LLVVVVLVVVGVCGGCVRALESARRCAWVVRWRERLYPEPRCNGSETRYKKSKRLRLRFDTSLAHKNLFLPIFPRRNLGHPLARGAIRRSLQPALRRRGFRVMMRRRFLLQDYDDKTSRRSSVASPPVSIERASASTRSFTTLSPSGHPVGTPFSYPPHPRPGHTSTKSRREII